MHYIPGIEITDPAALTAQRALQLVYRVANSKRRHPCSTLLEAQRMVNAYRDSHLAGASRFGGADVYEGAVFVAHVSFNGRVWSKESSFAAAARGAGVVL